MLNNRTNNFSSALIIAGDMNATIDPLYSKIRKQGKENHTFEGLKYLIEELNLTDTYRSSNPDKPDWTWMKRNYNTAPSNYQETRIDHILVNNHFEVLSSEIHVYSHLYSSDHKIINTKLRLNSDSSFLPQMEDNKSSHRAKLKTKNLTSEEIRKKLKEDELGNLDLLESTLLNINTENDRNTVQAQINSFYTNFIKHLRIKCTDIFKLTNEPLNQTTADPIENHKGIIRAKETLQKLGKLSELYFGNLVPSQEKMDRLCQKNLHNIQK